MHRRLLFIYLPWQTLRIPLFLLIVTFLHVFLHAEEKKHPQKGTTYNTAQPPSVMFVIDHSGSMYSEDGSDTLGNRFNVTRDLIDIILTYNPDAEVGVAVFNKHLYYDQRDDSIFASIPSPDNENAAFIPLLQLNKDYNGKKGYEILKYYLEIDTTLDTTNITIVNGVVTNVETRDLIILKYKSEWANEGATHINAGFNAAKKAMQSAKYPKENHFVIFFSDGDASFSVEGVSEDAFVEGTGVPTIFTVFFVNDTVPQQLFDMTENIQNSGYSITNPKSDLWAFNNTGYDTLMNFLIENILGFIIDEKAPKLIAYSSPTYDRRPLLKWNKPLVPGSNYTIQIDTVSSFSAPIITTPVVDTFYTPTIDLPMRTIYWRVKSDISAWSQASSFTILDNRVPALIPYSPEITNNTTPTLTWRSIANVSSYTIEVDNNSDFSSQILTMPVSDTSYTPSAPLPFGDIYWHVKCDLVDIWSVADHFFIQADSIPFLLRFNGSKISNPRPEFKWHPVAGATSYKILIADNSGFSNAINLPLADTLCILQADLALGKWFWKVSCSKDLELYSPVDSLVVEITGLIPEISQHEGRGVRFIQSHKDLRIILGGDNSKNVIADIYNIQGRIVSTLTADNSNQNVLYWNFSDMNGMAVPSGMYVVRVKTGDRFHTNRVIVSK